MRKLLIWFFFVSAPVLAQSDKDTCLSDFCGSFLTKQAKNKSEYSLELKNTKDSSRVKQLNLSGGLIKNLKTGTQTVQFIDVQLNQVRLKDAQKMRFDVDYEGRETLASVEMTNGKLNGKCEIKTRYIEFDKLPSDDFSVLFEFKNGKILGAISFKNAKGEKGVLRLNSLGFLDGKTELSYFENDILVSEQRIYKSGALLSIYKQFQNGKPIKINVLENEWLLNNLRGEEVIAYTLLFDNVFSENDSALRGQKVGNDFVQKMFDVFDNIIPYLSQENTSSEFPLTKRFYYPLSKNECFELNLLHERLLEIDTNIRKELSNPLLLLNVEIDSTLKRKYLELDFLKNINEQMLNHFQKLIQFKRLAFIPEGEHLQTKDYLRGAALDTLSFLITNYPEVTLFANEWQDDIYAKLNVLKTGLDSNLRILRKDEMNAKIAQLLKRNEVLYNAKSTSKLSYNFYQKLQKRKLQSLKEQYLQVSQVEKNGEFGSELLCFLETAHQHYNTIEKSALWLSKTDSLFTIFEAHPFDNRPFERKIIPNVREKGIILLQELVDLSFQIPKCNLIEQRLNAIDETIKKLADCRQNSQSEEVQQLNRLLRRENNPVRIARLLNIDFPN
jgi:hypothetical protein